MDKRPFVGVDVGGTKVAAGLVDASGGISAQVRVAMAADSGAERGLESVLSAIGPVLAHTTDGVAGIGICAPGPLDPHTGVILNPPNVPCWRNFPLADSVRRRHQVPVMVDNDANAAALAEARWGAARGYGNVFYATIGTGIGTGIVFDGKIYHGRTGAAGEGGHVSIDCRGPICNCGKPGCIEVLASGTALVKRAQQEAALPGSGSSMLELAGGDARAITGVTLAQAAEAGDRLANQILVEATGFVALWLSNIVDLFDPEVIVIGGGASALYRASFDRLRDQMAKFAVNPRAHEVPVLPARYGAESGIAGGAALCG